MRVYIILLIALVQTVCFSQEHSVSGRVVDAQNQPLSFVNVLVSEVSTEIGEAGVLFIDGTTTDDFGNFIIEGLSAKRYRLSLSFIGFTTKTEIIDLKADETLSDVVLEEDAEALETVVVTANRPTVKKEPGKLTFNVENTSLSSGSTLSLLTKTPGVAVLQGQIKIKNTAPTIYINNKRVYLSAAEVSTLLTNVDAAIIKSIEVITNPSSKYDAEAGTVLNIITSKAISVGYKGSVNASYEIGVLPKYNVGTSHFYKNDWINVYGSYGLSEREEIKEDFNFLRFQNPAGDLSSIWESDFTRRTATTAHQGNLIADFMLNEAQRLSLSSNVSVTPNRRFDNEVDATIFNAQQQVDSTFFTKSNVDTDSHNLSFSLEHDWKLNDNGSNLTSTANYIVYNNSRIQDVKTNYFLSNGDFLRSNSFETNANQDSNIFTGQLDFRTLALDGNLETGLKYSNIDTESGLDFFNIQNGVISRNSDLSDLFNYKESIYAAYASFSKNWEKWNVTLGLRTEYTDVSGTSVSLGAVNTQEYVEWFPNGALQHKINENNSAGLAYARRIERPRYQSLNPFLYFLNENNFSGGNPNLVPAIETKITLDYNFKNQLFFELYYQEFDNALEILAYQDNENNTLRSIDSNLISEYQYSFDVVYANPIQSWWYLSVVTSAFYIENEFFAIESDPLTYTNDTFGFYGQVYSGLTLSQAAGLSSDVTAVYISNLIYGNYSYKNQFNLSISFRKKFWDNRASLTAGVDDIFNTNNIPLTSRYYNQDNGYFAQIESRLFRVGFTYNFGNARLRDNKRTTKPKETQRLD